MERQRLTRQTVITRAAELADRDGFDALSLASVARSLRVQTPTLYGHVRDLAALRDGVAECALEDLAADTTEAIAGRSGREALGAFADAYRAYARQHPGRWDSLQRRIADDAEVSAAGRRVAGTAAALLRGYGLPDADRVHATRIVGAAINGFVNLERTGAYARSTPPADDTWAELVDALHLVLTHRSAAGRAEEGPSA